MGIEWTALLTGVGPYVALVLFIAYTLWRGRPPSEEYASNLVARVTKLENDLLGARGSLTDYQIQIAQLQQQLHMLESAHQRSPFPTWIKDLNGVMLSVNKAYEDKYLIPHGKSIRDVVGRTDKESWSDGKFVDSWYRTDKLVKDTGHAHGAIETAPNPNGKDLPDIKIVVVKWLRIVGGVPMGIAGQEISTAVLEEVGFDTTCLLDK